MTPFTASDLRVQTGHNALPAVTVVRQGVLRIPVGGGPLRAGAQTGGTTGLSGSTRTLAACAIGPCNDSFRGASAARLVPGQFAAWLELTLNQPTRTGTAFQFDVEFAVRTAAGWFVGFGYFSSGTTSARTSQAVLLDVLVDLGTRVLPTVSASGVALSLCTVAPGCP